MRDFQRKLKLNYRFIADAQEFYEELGYIDTAAPWVVSIEAYTSTLPPRTEHYGTLGGFLVGSAEQSFIHMLLENGGPLGRIQASTPCFRSEDHDDLHSPYFFKTELYDDTMELADVNVLRVLNDARAFFERYIETEIEQTDEHQWDIVAKGSGIELGSYGIRRYNSFGWIYGTGVALPRLEQAIAANQTS